MGTVIDFRTCRVLKDVAVQNQHAALAQITPAPRFCNCGCGGEILNPRSTSEIMDDLRPLAMLGESAAAKRDALIAELQKIPNVHLFVEAHNPKGAS